MTDIGTESGCPGELIIEKQTSGAEPQIAETLAARGVDIVIHYNSARYAVLDTTRCPC